MPRAVAFCLSLLTALPTLAHADRPVCAEAPPDEEVRRRLAALETMVRDNEPPIRRWYTSFALLHGTMLSGTIVVAASTPDEGQRNELIVGATSSTLALATLLIFTPPLMGAGDGLRALPASTPEERLAKLRAAEHVMRRASDGVDFLQSWFPATASLVYVAAASGTLLLAFERNIGAFTHSVGGTILGLARVLLHPTGSRDAWGRYARAYEDADCEPIDAPMAALPGPSWRLAPRGLGLGLVVRF